jgi:ATP-dependent DNA helicase RecG
MVDEQHRFGVAQRLALRNKLAEQGLEPHLLMMSATPIPRTLAMSYLRRPGREHHRRAAARPHAHRHQGVCRRPRDEVIERIRDEVALGPAGLLGLPADRGERGAGPAPNATATHAELSAALPGRAVGLLHGRMPRRERSRDGAFHLGRDGRCWSATTVIEVGVDVPNASLMVIEHAERFGLAQLHQLRGRVGRGAVASACVLLYTAPLSRRRGRLKAMAETTDGFEIARRDLDIRGPGEFMGARQSARAAALCRPGEDAACWKRPATPRR